MFDEIGVLVKVVAGELAEILLSSNHPSPPKADEEVCTLSQMVSYRNRFDKEIAQAHRYVRTDGSLGASGRPDPKRVFYQGTIYLLDERA